MLDLLATPSLAGRPEHGEHRPFRSYLQWTRLRSFVNLPRELSSFYDRRSLSFYPTCSGEWYLRNHGQRVYGRETYYEPRRPRPEHGEHRLFRSYLQWTRLRSFQVVNLLPRELSSFYDRYSPSFYPTRSGEWYLRNHGQRV